MSSSLKIDDEFRSLLIPLTDDEYSGLEQSILSGGCRVALDVWDDTLIDGHNRYEICQKHNIPFETKSIDFDSRADAKIWIAKNQLSRRNLPAFVKIELAKLIEPELKEKARENLSLVGGDRKSEEYKSGCLISDKAIEPIDTKKEIAKIAGVGHDTVAKASKIIEKAPEEVKQAVRTGQKSINEAYKEIKKEERQTEIEQQRQQKAEEAKQNKTVLDIDFRQGDFRQVFADIPDNSIDLILTDPPYPEEFLPLWEDLAIFAKRVLKPNRFLIAYSGQLHLNKVYDLLSKHLNYYWTFTLLHNGGHQLINARNIFCNWKPMLVFQNGLKRIDTPIDDIVRGSGREKDDHDWQQGESELEYILEKFTVESEIVLDPFAGSGTTLKMAKMMKRQAMGSEIDNDTYWIAYNKLQS